MMHRHPADIRAKTSLRVMGRRRRKHRRVLRVIESIAAVIPSIVLILHLLSKSTGMAAEHPDNGVQQPVTNQQAVAGLPVTAVPVPEPNAPALVLLGAGALLYFRRKADANRSATALAL